MATIRVVDAPATTRDLFAAIRNGSDGATVDSFQNPLPDRGYWVGGQSWTLVKAVERVTPDDVAGYVSAHPYARYFGVWVDQGRAYLDVVDHVDAPRDAHAMATDRQEIAVFNIATAESEYVS